MKQIALAFAIAAGTLVSASAFAQTQPTQVVTSNVPFLRITPDAHAYAGVSIGESKFQTDDVPDATIDNRDTGWKIFGGYQFHRNFAVEGGYVDLGRATATATFGTSTLSEKIAAKGPFIDVLGILPLTNNFSIYAKVGGIYAKVTDSVDGTGGFAGFSNSDDESKFKAIGGLGAQFDFTSNFAVRGEWERYFNLETSSGDTSNVDLFSINAVVSFR